MKKLISKLLITILGISLFSQTTFAEFKDVDSKTDYFTAINWMTSNEIIRGYKDGNFMPDKCVSRSEFLKILFLTLEADLSAAIEVEPFTDTPADAWYIDFVKIAKFRGTIQGYEGNTFKPDQCVSRAEAIKMALLEFNSAIPESEKSYEGTAYDVETPDEETNPWFYPYIDYALSANIVGQKHTKPVKNRAMMFYFYPDASMSRKEVAEMLYRMKTIKDYDLEIYSDPSEIPNNRNLGLNIGVDYQVYAPISLKVSDEVEMVIKAVSELPEVQQKMEDIALANSDYEEGGVLHHFEMRTLATPTATDPYYKIIVGEDNGVSVVTHYIFYVHKDTLEMKIIHPVTGELMTIEQWRQSNAEEEVPSI